MELWDVVASLEQDLADAEDRLVDVEEAEFTITEFGCRWIDGFEVVTAIEEGWGGPVVKSAYICITR